MIEFLSWKVEHKTSRFSYFLISWCELLYQIGNFIYARLKDTVTWNISLQDILPINAFIKVALIYFLQNWLGNVAHPKLKKILVYETWGMDFLIAPIIMSIDFPVALNNIALVY